MPSSYLHDASRQKAIAIIVIIIIGIPIVAFGHAEVTYGSYDTTPVAAVQLYTLKDIWYPLHGDWQPFPLLLTGNISSYYTRPVVMCPYRVVIEILVEDLTNSSSDLSWIGGADYAFLRDNGYVNTTLTPYVNGNFGDNEGYAINVTEWTYWPTRGIRTVSSCLERGISYKNWDLTDHQVGDKYSICSMDFRFSPDSSAIFYEWSLLFELAILTDDAILLEGHELQLTVKTTSTWIPLFVLSLPGEHTQSMSITQENSLYVLEGDVEIQYDWGD